MLKASVVIATYHRPKEIVDCIQSLLDQTVLPHQILVIDDGELETPPMEAECQAKGVGYVYFRKDKPDLTRSRNIGVSLSTGDVVFFFDDDCIMEPQYLEETLKLYDQEDKDGRKVGGVGGIITNNHPWTWKDTARYYYHRLFMLVGPREGRILRSGFCADYYLTPNPITEVVDVDFFSGGVCSYRREVFDKVTFTPGYRKHALGEDKDFSYQVSRHYRLLMTPAAKLAHYESPSMRPNKRKQGRMFINGRYLFFKLCTKRHSFDWIFFIYANLGYTFTRLVALILFPNKDKVERLKGMFEAYRAILTGNGPKLRHLTPSEAAEIAAEALRAAKGNVHVS